MRLERTQPQLMKFAVVVFPGSNCDHDAYHAAKHVLGQEAEFVWHKDTILGGADVVILPGGFSYGDYLRTGAIARFSPVMDAVTALRRRGGPVLGICNGFQILLEAGLLPGALLRNRGLKFLCEHVSVRVEQTDTPFTGACRARPGAAACRSPTARATTSPPDDVLDALERERRVVFRYVDARGEPTGRGEPERLGAQHRRHLQRAPQRRRHDAAPGARLRAAARQRRRPACCSSRSSAR